MKIKRFNTLFFILLINTFSINLLAQDSPGHPNELDNIYVPTNSSVFNNETNNASSNKNSSSSDFKNIISFNPTMLLRSIAALEYSRIIGEYVLLQGGLGECFGIDQIANVGNSIGDISNNTNTNSSLVPLANIMSTAAFSAKSLYSSFSFKFITNDDWDWTSYIELNARFYSNNLYLNKLSDVGSNDVFNGTHNIVLQNRMFNLIVGKQLITDGGIKLSHDFFTGFGLRVLSYNTYQTTLAYDSSGNTYNIYSDAAEKQKMFLPSILIGYKLGFGF